MGCIHFGRDFTNAGIEPALVDKPWSANLRAMNDSGMYPFEFLLHATPLSLQTKNRVRYAAWKDEVGAIAMDRRNEVCGQVMLDDRPLAATILYFTAAPLEGDVDNIVKPILDGLREVAYPDDRQIERVVVQKLEPGISWVVEASTDQISAALDAEPPVVYVRIEADLSWRIL